MNLDDLLQQQELRWKSNCPIIIEHLAHECLGEAFESLLDSEKWLELICNEVMLREQRGERPTLTEYQLRFPDLAEALSIQWGINRLFDANESLTNSLAAFDDRTLLSLSVDSQSSNEKVNDRESPQARYEIRQKIGQGAVGVVFEAWDTHLHRLVALKRLRSGTDATVEEFGRMRAEAEAIAKIRHPSIVQVFDVGEEDGLPFMAMELCHGGTLSGRLQGIPLSPILAAEVVLQIANAMAAAHDCRIVHRDLKPGNILMNDPNSWIAKVSDFGLAKALDNDNSATATGSIIGTPAYMAPEQAFGEAKYAGPAADIYSIGAILYECLTGRPPFQAETIAATLDQVRNLDPVGVRRLQPNVPVDLETIAMVCLRKEPFKRYSSSSELAGDLSRFMRGDSITARQESLHEAAVRTFRRHPVSASLALTSVGLLLLITIGLTASIYYFNRERRIAVEAKGQARLGEANALLGQAHGTRLSGRPGQRFVALEAIRQAVSIGREQSQSPHWFEPYRDEAIAALMLPDAYVQQYRKEAKKVLYTDFSDDHRLCAFSFDGDHDISIRLMASHHEIARIPRLKQNTRVEFVENSRLLCTGETDGAFELWSVETAAPQRLWRHESGGGIHDVSRDQQWLTTVSSTQVQVIQLSDGKIVSRMPSEPFNREGMVAMHPTHPLISLSSYFAATIEIRNWKTCETVAHIGPDSLEGLPAKCKGVAWSPKGDQLVFFHGDGQQGHWFQFDPESYTVARIHGEHRLLPSEGGRALRFNCTGDRIFAKGWSNNFTIMEASAGYRIISSLSTQWKADEFQPPRVDPLGRYAGFVCSTDNPFEVGLMEIADARECHLALPRESGHAGVFAFDPTGRILVSIGDGLNVIDVQTGRTILCLKIDQFGATSVCFDEVGNLFTNSQSGCFRWPLRITTNESSCTVQLDVPERIHVPFGPVTVSSSSNGQTLAFCAWNGLGTQEYAGFWVQTQGEPAARKFIGNVSGHACDVSADGQMVAGAGSFGLKVLKCTDDCRQVYAGPSGIPKFSRDGKWLMADGRLLRTDTFASETQLGGGLLHDLSGDATVALSYLQSNAACLVDTQTGNVLARFDGLGELRSLMFSSNQETMALYNKDGLYLCNLRQIRAKLKELQLDWHAAPFPTTTEFPAIEQVILAPEFTLMQTAEDLSELVDQRAMERSRKEPNNGYVRFSAAMVSIDQRRYAQALDELNVACELLPSSITTRQWRAYLLAELRQFDSAIRDASWALARHDQPDLRLLMVEWLYRENRFQEAIDQCNLLFDMWPNPAREYGLRSVCYAALGDAEIAKADDGKFIELARNHPDSLNMIAGPFSGPDISLRSPILSLKFVERLQALQSEFGPELAHTIGRVLFQNDRFAESAQWLESNMGKGDAVYDGFHLYVLSMVYSKLGKADDAALCLQRADVWRLSKKLEFRDHHELEILCAEANLLMSIKSSPSE